MKVLSLTEKESPAHADYVAAVRIESDDENYPVVEVHWYPDGLIRFQLKKAAPAALVGAYLEGEGRDINLKIQK